MGFAAALLFALVVAGAFVYWLVGNALNSTINDGLESRSDDLATLVHHAARNPRRLENQRLLGAENNAEGFSQILNERGKVIATTLRRSAGAALDPPLVQRASRESVLVTRRIPGIEGHARILGRPAKSGGKRFVIVAGASTDDRREALAGLTKAFLVGTPLALALASLLGYLLAGRSLSPVEAMRRRAREITLDRTGERLPLPRAEDEIHRLGQTLNTMLDRIEAGLQRERVFVADASHELRTPLALLRAELELADRPERSSEDLHAAIQSASEEVDRLSQLAEDLLVIARSDQGQVPISREPVQPRQVLERVRGRFVRRASNSGREIVVDEPGDLNAALDPYRIEQALGNLVDNALRHGAGEIRLSAREADGSLILDVSDQGHGFDAGFESEAFERFSRGDAGRSGGGAGLGLAIVQAIAAAHGGQALVVSQNATTTVRLTLPAVSLKP